MGSAGGRFVWVVVPPGGGLGNDYARNLASENAAEAATAERVGQTKHIQSRRKAARSFDLWKGPLMTCGCYPGSLLLAWGLV